MGAGFWKAINQSGTIGALNTQKLQISVYATHGKKRFHGRKSKP